MNITNFALYFESKVRTNRTLCNRFNFSNRVILYNRSFEILVAEMMVKNVYISKFLKSKLNFSVIQKKNSDIDVKYLENVFCNLEIIYTTGIILN